MTTLVEALTEQVLAPSICLDMARYRFEFRTTAPILLPEYSGSTIRGAFGRSLRRIGCMTRQDDCKHCPLYRSCPYTAVFETPPPQEHSLQKFSQIPNAYVIEPPNWGRRVCSVGEPLIFDLVLFGKARHHLALIVFALQKAFSYEVGHGRAEFVRLSKVDVHEETVILEAGMERIIEHDICTMVAVPNGGAVQVNILTPLRLQCNGVPLGPEKLTARSFLMAVARRVALISEFQVGVRLPLDFHLLPEEANGINMHWSLGWKDWTRYSSRQQQKMSLGGVVGSLIFEELPLEFRLLLTAGTMTHVGKNASFGLGGIRLG